MSFEAQTQGGCLIGSALVCAAFAPAVKDKWVVNPGRWNVSPMRRAKSAKDV